jgi:hypothetical protein
MRAAAARLQAHARLVEHAYARGLIIYSRRTRGGHVGRPRPGLPADDHHRGADRRDHRPLTDALDALRGRTRPAGGARGVSAIIISCAITGSIHTPSLSPHLPVTAEIAGAGDRRGGGGGGDPAPARPRPGRPALGRSGALDGLPAAHPRRDRRGVNMTTGGSALMSLDERLAGAEGRAPEMVLAQHGHDELRALPAAAKVERLEARLGAPFLEGSDDLIFRNTPRDIARAAEMGAARRALRVRVLRHGASAHAAAFPRPRAGGAAALHPVRLRGARRHGGRSRDAGLHEGDRRPAVRRGLPLLGARRGTGADPARDDLGGDGRACAGRARGQPLHRQGVGWRARTPSR